MNFKTFSSIILIIMVAYSCKVDHYVNKTKPNIVIILADDQGWGDLSYNGNTSLHTPNIDQLAKRGASFEYFYVSPVCSPTRAELLTGRYHTRSGVFDTSAGGELMNLDETTLAEVFKSSGYATAAFGKWHNGSQPPYHPNSRGFDEFFGFCSGHWGDYFNSMLLEHNGELVQGKGYLSDDLTDKAMDFIENNKNQPFFLYIPYNTPHSPMQVPDEYFDKFESINLNENHPWPGKEDKEFTKAALAMSENLDWNVGRIMQKLRDLNIEENTIVLYLSDNGPNGSRWNGGMKGIKGSTDEGGVRSPLFIQWPKVIGSGIKIKEISAAIDLLPTLADLAGISLTLEKPLDGLSLKPLLLQEQVSWKDRLIFSFWNGRTSVRSQQYRLDHQGALFDMIEDGQQTKDVSDKLPEVARSLKEQVEKWNETVLAELKKEDRPFPVGHPDFKSTLLPARDGIAHGNIMRSNRFPNSSFFSNWISKDDKITWDIEVISSGNYEVLVFYTCPLDDVGSIFQLSFGKYSVSATVSDAYDPPLTGMEYDRVERIESYVKDFRPLSMGTMHLEKGKGELTLKALEIPGKQVMDFRLLVFTRVDL
jgi:arylsulfatase A-like enzyme